MPGCLGLGHIASQCPNKRAVFLHDNGEVVNDSDGDEMPELEDASDGDGIEYLVIGKHLWCSMLSIHKSK